MIIRENYLGKLKGFKDKKLIKVITGIRRCGKSTLLEMFQEYLISSGVDKDQIISINFEDMDFDELRDAKSLYNYVKEKVNDEKTNYIFLDEIQQVEDFQRAVDSLYNKKIRTFTSLDLMQKCCQVRLQHYCLVGMWK